MSGSVVQSSSARMRFPDISPRAFEHPADRGAMAALRAVPGAAEALKVVSGTFTERGERLMALASAIRVGPKQYPRLHALRTECAEVLDLPAVPDLFVARNPDANAYTIGIDEPFIVLTTALVEALDPESLRFVIGHEMGHVLSGHAMLRTVMYRLLRLQQVVTWMPAGAIGLRAVLAALREWYRKAELSCDRAGLLCSQDPAAALRAHLYSAGGTDAGEIDIPSFLQQAREYEQVDDLRDSVLKMVHVESMSHPFFVVRATQLQRWAATEEYRAILGGQYPRRSDADPVSSLNADIAAAARSYRDTFSQSADPLLKVFGEVGRGVSDAAGKAWNRFNGGDGAASD